MEGKASIHDLKSLEEGLVLQQNDEGCEADLLPDTAAR